MANAGFDRAFVLISALGYAWGVVPFDVVLVLALALRRRLREGLFAGISHRRFAVAQPGREAFFRAHKA